VEAAGPPFSISTVSRWTETRAWPLGFTYAFNVDNYSLPANTVDVSGAGDHLNPGTDAPDAVRIALQVLRAPTGREVRRGVNEPLLVRARGASRMESREDTELAPSFNAVGCKISMINGKNCEERLASCEIHKCAVGEVHGPVPVSRHQRVHVPQFAIFDGAKKDCSGADEVPGCFHLRTNISNEVEQLRKNSLGSQKGKPELPECADAGIMPSIGPVE
jgi:hypothetical protein